MTALLLWLTAWSAAWASPGTELFLVLDNSCSMAVDYRDPALNQRFSANDPERAAVLGALIVEGLARGSNDRFTVAAFGDGPQGAPPILGTASEIRSLPYSGGTWYTPPLTEAWKRLVASDRERKMLLVFSDGAPEDIQTPAQAAALMDLDAHPEIDTMILGLYGSPVIRSRASMFLEPLAHRPSDVSGLSDASEVVPWFTEAYARALGSRPQSGRMKAGESLTVEVGRYVTEVMVVTASVDPGPAFRAELVGPDGKTAVQAQGDDGCEGSASAGVPASVCATPRRHYQVFRAPNDVTRKSTWTLSLPQASRAVRYGVILRYDLSASIAVPPDARVGEALTVDARLLFRGETFFDEDFFTADGFSVRATIDGEELPLVHTGEGKFTGTWTPSTPTSGQTTSATVHFENDWMEASAQRRVTVEGFLPLELIVPAIDLGYWEGERGHTERCAVVDLSASTNAARIPLECTLDGGYAEASVRCRPLEAEPGQQPLKWQVCVETTRCCGAVPGPGEEVRVGFRGAHAHYHPAAVVRPIQLEVRGTSWLTCWWVELLIALAVLAAILFIVGWIRPSSFDPSSTVRIASKEAGLRRTAALILAEQPGGRRGFYRNARLCVDGQGNCVRRPQSASLVVEARGAGTTAFTKAGGLERKNRRTRKWEAVPHSELSEGPVPGTIYRLGSSIFKFG